jgi:hypothetical protein
MRNWPVVVLVALGAALLAGDVSAQALRGFAGGGMVKDLNGQTFPAVSGGAVVDLPTSWFSAGAQGDMFISWPYFAGRGTVFGQVNVIRRGPVRPFLLGGFGFGEDGGPMIGGGVDVRVPNQRIGLRVSVEDYLAHVGGFDCFGLGYTQAYCDANLKGGRPYTAHQTSLRVALLF